MKTRTVLGVAWITLILGLVAVLMAGCNDKDPGIIDVRLVPGVWEVVADGNQDVFQRGGFADIRVSSDATNENPHGYLTTFFLTVGGIVKPDEVYSWSIREPESSQPLVDLVFEGMLDSEDPWDGYWQYRIIKLTESHMWWKRNSVGEESIIKLRRRTDIDQTPTLSPLPNITINNFPVIDGSDSTDPLRDILMCRILGFGYKWERRPFTQDPQADIKDIIPEYTCSESDWRHLERECLKHSNTHQSFINLIDDKVELVIAARSISRDEKVYAEENGVTLIEKPIAKDALTFMVNPSNPVNNLSISQLQGIYTGDIKNWNEAGGNDEEIKPYVRNRNSGSQEKFETLVMAGLKIAEFPELQVGLTMMSPYYQLEEDKQGIGFSPFYYYSVIVDNGSTKAIGLDGVPMTKENVQNNTYPYTTDVYAAVRSDIDRNSTAYELFEFLTTPAGQSIINESGYVPLNQDSGIRGIDEDTEKSY